MTKPAARHLSIAFMSALLISAPVSSAPSEKGKANGVSHRLSTLEQAFVTFRGWVEDMLSFHDERIMALEEAAVAIVPGGNYVKWDLGNAELSGYDLTAANFTMANLAGTNLSGSDLSFTNFSAANLQSANISASTIRDTVFVDTELQGTSFDGSTWTGGLLAFSSLSDIDFGNVSFHIGSSGQFARITGKSITNSSFQGADLRDARIALNNGDSGLELDNVDFSYAQMTSDSFVGVIGGGPVSSYPGAAGGGYVGGIAYSRVQDFIEGNGSSSFGRLFDRAVCGPNGTTVTGGNADCLRAIIDASSGGSVYIGGGNGLTAVIDDSWWSPDQPNGAFSFTPNGSLVSQANGYWMSYPLVDYSVIADELGLLSLNNVSFQGASLLNTDGSRMASLSFVDKFSSTNITCPDGYLFDAYEGTNTYQEFVEANPGATFGTITFGAMGALVANVCEGHMEP